MALLDWLGSLFRRTQGGKVVDKEIVKPEFTGYPQDLRDFLLGKKIDPGSTYADTYQYDMRTEFVVAYFDDGRVAAYKCSPQTAVAFFNAQSKGVFIWDNFRVRGTVHEHRVPWRYV